MRSQSVKPRGRVRLECALAVVLAFAAAPVLSRAQSPVSPDEAVALLKKGNARFVLGKLQPKAYAVERHALASGQHPYAIVLACADSRVSPEIIFDESLGKLFVIRVAGNVVDPVVLGSVEYAAEHLHASLLVVLGHEGCGAVKAAVDGGEASTNLGAIVTRIAPAVERARAQKATGPALYDAAVSENVREQVEAAVKESSVLQEFVAEKKLRIVGAVYDLDSGAVGFLPTAASAGHSAH